jgi:hypothetical protein
MTRGEVAMQKDTGIAGAEYSAALAEAIELGLMTAKGEATERCQCAECLKVFSTEHSFDTHRVDDRCVYPKQAGLVQHPAGWWHRPGADEGWTKSLRARTGVHHDGGANAGTVPGGGDQDGVSKRPTVKAERGVA